MNLFYFIFACAILGKTRGNLNYISEIGYFPKMQSMPCEEWTVDLVDTCDEISFVKRAGNPFVMPDSFETFPTAFYYPTATIGVKGKYGLNPAFNSISKIYDEIGQIFNTDEGGIEELFNCSIWSPILNCINEISNNDFIFAPTNESMPCNETTKAMMKTNFLDFSNPVLPGFPPFLMQLPEKKQCIEMYNTISASEIDDIQFFFLSNTSYSATIQPKSDGVSVGVIVGIVVGSVVVLLGIGIGIWYFKPIASSDDTELFLKQ